jgi:hypothetical protein
MSAGIRLIGQTQLASVQLVRLLAGRLVGGEGASLAAPLGLHHPFQVAQHLAALQEVLLESARAAQ